MSGFFMRSLPKGYVLRTRRLVFRSTDGQRAFHR